MSTTAPARRPSEVLAEHRDEVRALLEKYGAENPRVFGSVARGEDTPASDIDILVYLDPGRAWGFYGVLDELTALLGMPVDVISDGGLKPKHAQILQDARPL